MLDTVVISGDDVCCKEVFGTRVGVFVFSVMSSELLMTSAINCPLWSYSVSKLTIMSSISVRVPESGVCLHISGKN